MMGAAIGGSLGAAYDSYMSEQRGALRSYIDNYAQDIQADIEELVKKYAVATSLSEGLSSEKAEGCVYATIRAMCDKHDIDQRMKEQKIIADKLQELQDLQLQWARLNQQVVNDQHDYIRDTMLATNATPNMTLAEAIRIGHSKMVELPRPVTLADGGHSEEATNDSYGFLGKIKGFFS